MDPRFTIVGDDPDHANSSSIKCELDFFSTLEENPVVFRAVPLNESQPNSDFQLEVDDFLKSLVSNNEPIQKEENLINGQSLRHIDLDLASENSKLKMIIKKLRLKNLKQESKFAVCESNLAEKWNALDITKKELKTVKEQCQIFETENSTLKNNVAQLEVQVNQYSYVKLQKDVVDEKLAVLEKDIRRYQGHIKRFKGMHAKNRKEVFEVRENLKKKDQHIQNIWKMILALGTNHKKTGLKNREKNRLKKEYVEWFPSEITQNTGKVEVIDNLKDITASLFKELTISPEDIHKANQSTNKEQPNDSTPALLSSNDKVSSSDDSPAKTDQILQDKLCMKLPTTYNKEVPSLKNAPSYPCSPDTLSHDDTENTNAKLTSSAISLHQDPSLTDTLLNVNESPSQQLSESLFSASLTSHSFSGIGNTNIDNRKEQSQTQISYSLCNTTPLVEVQVDDKRHSPLEIKPLKSVKGSECALSELLLGDIALSNESLLDPNPGKVSDAENLNDDWSFNFNETDDQDATRKVTSLMEIASNECDSTEPIIENLTLHDNADALNGSIPHVPFNNAQYSEEKASIGPLKKHCEIIKEQKVNGNVSFVSEDLAISSGCVSVEPIVENLALSDDSADALNGSFPQVPFENAQSIEENASIDPLKKHSGIVKEKVTSNRDASFVSDDLETTLKELEQFRSFFSICKHPLSPFPPTPPKVKSQTESLKEEINSECNATFSQVASPTKLSNKKSKTLKESHMLQSSNNHSFFDEEKSSANSCEQFEDSYSNVEPLVDAVSTEYYDANVDHKLSKTFRNSSTIVANGAVKVIYNKPFIKFVPGQKSSDNSCASDSLPPLKSPIKNDSELATCPLNVDQEVKTKCKQNSPAKNSFATNTHINGNSSVFLPFKNYNNTEKSEDELNTNDFNCIFSLDETFNKSETIVKNNYKSSSDGPTEKMAKKTLKRSQNQLVENQFNEPEFKAKAVNLASEPIKQNNLQKTPVFAANVHIDNNISNFQPEPLKDNKFDESKKATILPMDICKKNELEMVKQSDSNFQPPKKLKIMLEEQTSSTAPVRIRGRTKLSREMLGKHNVQTESKEEIKENFGNDKELNNNQALVNEATTMLEESTSESSYVAVHKSKKIRIEHRKNTNEVSACEAEFETKIIFDKSLKYKEPVSPEVTFEEKHVNTDSNIKTPNQINLTDFSLMQPSMSMNIEQSTPSGFGSTHKERERPTCIEDIISSIRNAHPQNISERTLGVVKDHNLDEQCLSSKTTINNKCIETDVLMAGGKDDSIHISNTNINKSCDIKENRIENSLICEGNISDSSNRTMVSEQHLKASTITSGIGCYPQFQKKENQQKITSSKTSKSSINERTFITNAKHANKIVALNANEGHGSTLHQKPSCSQAKDYGKKRKRGHLTCKLPMKKRKGMLKVQKPPKRKCALTSSNDKTFNPDMNAKCDSAISDFSENKSVSLGTDEKSCSVLHQKAPCPEGIGRVKRLLRWELRKKERKIMSQLKKLNDKKSATDENPLEKLFQNEQLSQENFKCIVHSLVRLLINPSNSPNKAALLFLVIDYLRNFKKCPLVAFLSSEDPSILLPFEEKCIVVALFRIELKKIPRLDGLLKTAITTLHNVILSKKFHSSSLASLCRIFTELCKREENSVKPVMLCAELLKTKHNCSSYLVASVAGVWKELFQIENHMSVEEKLLHSSILYGAKKKPKRVYGVYWESSMNIISKNFSAPPVRDARSAMHILKNFIQSKCQSNSWNSQYMTSALTILAVYEDWGWIQENLLDKYILPNLTNFGKTTLNEFAFNLYCNLYVDIYFLKPGVFAIDTQLSNIYNYPETWQGEFVNDCVALALIRLVFLKNKIMPSFLSSWFESNHQKPKVQEHATVFNRGLMHASPTELKIEEIH